MTAATTTTKYHYGQGKVYTSPINPATGLSTGFTWLGDCKTLKASLQNTKKKVYENYSGQALLASTVITGLDGTLDIDALSVSVPNLALSFRGVVTTKTTGTVTGEVLGVVSAGLLYGLENANVSSVVVTDSATPAHTLVENTDYTVDYQHGSITFITAPVTAVNVAYTYGASQSVSAFTAPLGLYAVRYEGTNLATGGYEILEVWNTRLDPPKDLSMISNDFASFAISGDILVDPTKINLPAYGPMVRVTQI